MKAFINNTSLRDSCFKCKFKLKEGVSDITLGDFWGIKYIDKNFFDNKGTSLVIVNTEKGNEIFEKIKQKIKYAEINVEDAIYYNTSMVYSALPDKDSKNFYKNIGRISFEDLVNKYANGQINRLVYLNFKIKRKLKKFLKNNI